MLTRVGVSQNRKLNKVEKTGTPAPGVVSLGVWVGSRGKRGGGGTQVIKRKIHAWENEDDLLGRG